MCGASQHFHARYFFFRRKPSQLDCKTCANRDLASAQTCAQVRFIASAFFRIVMLITSVYEFLRVCADANYCDGLGNVPKSAARRSITKIDEIYHAVDYF